MVDQLDSPPATGGLLKLAAEHVEELTAIRRDLHAHPELGFEETRTSALVAEKLGEWGIKNVTRMAGTGLVATISGTRPGSRTIGLRADMDALALTEANSFGHVSRHPGKMHACGHDGHTTMLLGAARALAANPDFAGTVHLIFQPAEEGRGGAERMLEEGLDEKFPCDRLFGMHSAPELPVGTFATAVGPLMAASGRFEVTFRGQGGHGGAGPHLTQDLTVAAASYILALQTVVSRNVSAFEPAIISVGHIHAGSPEALNVLPSELVLGGTMRAFSTETQQLVEERIRALAELHAAANGATCTVGAHWGSVPLVTDAEATASALKAAAALGHGVNVDPDGPRTTGGEDFAYMLEKRPGSFMWLGNHSENRPGGGGGQLHTPDYDFNDAALPWGVAYWLSVVNTELDGQLGT